MALTNNNESIADIIPANLRLVKSKRSENYSPKSAFNYNHNSDLGPGDFLPDGIILYSKNQAYSRNSSCCNDPAKYSWN